MEDITQILAMQVKKEMADRYFGFRKRIEDDSTAYSERLNQSVLELKNDIGTTFLRLYTLLKTESLIREFMDLTHLPHDLFYTQYLHAPHSSLIQNFANQHYHGLTHKRAFRNMFFDNYIHLSKHIDAYRETLKALTDEQETIREEINLFYRNNDIDSIMQFIRKFDSPDSYTLNTLQPNAKGEPAQSLSCQLRMSPPRPANEILPSIPALPPLKTIKSKLQKIVDAAFENNRNLDLKELTGKS